VVTPTPELELAATPLLMAMQLLWHAPVCVPQLTMQLVKAGLVAGVWVGAGVAGVVCVCARATPIACTTGMATEINTRKIVRCARIRQYPTTPPSGPLASTRMDFFSDTGKEDREPGQQRR
jgi:hypothetical protein